LNKNIFDFGTSLATPARTAFYVSFRTNVRNLSEGAKKDFSLRSK
jgi:hypothetical protein